MQDFESHPQTTLDLAQRHDIRLAVRQPVHRQENPVSRTRDLLHLTWVSLTVTTYPGDYPGAQSGNQHFRPDVQSSLPPLNPVILFRDQVGQLVAREQAVRIALRRTGKEHVVLPALIGVFRVAAAVKEAPVIGIERAIPTLAWTLALVGQAVVEQVLLERSEEHTSELQSLMRISYAVFC